MHCQAISENYFRAVNMAHNENAPTPDGFGERLREAIERAGLNQRTFAHKLRLSEGAVSKWVNLSNEPDLATLSRIASVLSVSIDWLVDGKSSVRPVPHRPSVELVKAVKRLIRSLDAAGQAAAAVAEHMPDDET